LYQKTGHKAILYVVFPQICIGIDVNPQILRVHAYPIDFGGRVPLFVLEFFGLGTNHHFPPDSEPACFPFEIRILPTQIQTPGKQKTQEPSQCRHGQLGSG
jgi:hypothetical protein